jgi:CHASE1-domain containing sensor protein
MAVLLLGTVLSFGAFEFTRHLIHQEVAISFQAAAQERVHNMKIWLDEWFQDVNILRNLYESSDEITRQDFDSFTGPLLARHPSILAFQWLPEVNDQNRARLEAEARKSHPDFRFFRMDSANYKIDLISGLGPLKTKVKA